MEDFFSTWANFIFLAALFIIGIILYKWIADIVSVYFKNHQEHKNKVEVFLDKVYGLPKTVKSICKVLGTVVYLGVCILVIAFASM